MADSDSLIVGVDGVGEEGDLPSLSVFRRTGEHFEALKCYSGEMALYIYGLLTQGPTSEVISHAPTITMQDRRS